MESHYKSIEAILQEKAETDSTAKNLWCQYSAMKNYLSRQYYPWVQANCPYFTDHGQAHIESVIQSSSQILSKSLQNSSPKVVLTSLDLYILLCSVIWHDIGMVFERSGHSNKVKEIIDRIKELGFPDPSVSRLVSELVKAHEERNGLIIPEREQDCTVNTKTYTVFPRALAAIVRFADEISENRSRISPSLLKNGKIPKENLIYWEHANCLTASRADPYRERVIVTVEIEVDKAIAVHCCPEECKQHSGDGESISLIEYLVARLQKMNNERAYCAREFERYASIRKIEVRLKLIKGGQRVENYGDTFELDDFGLVHVLDKGVYPPIEIFDGFFERYPHWSPNRIKEV